MRRRLKGTRHAEKRVKLLVSSGKGKKEVNCGKVR